MAVRLKRGPITVLVIAGVIGAFFAIRSIAGKMPGHEAEVPKVATLPQAPEPVATAARAVSKAPMPTTTLAGKGTDVRMMV